jgi:hypothetical protein
LPLWLDHWLELELEEGVDDEDPPPWERLRERPLPRQLPEEPLDPSREPLDGRSEVPEKPLE